MEDENTRTLEKTSLLGSEKRLFRSLSGSDSTKNSKYQKIPNTQYGKYNSDIQEEVETTNEFHDSMPGGYSLGPELETCEDEKKKLADDRGGLSTFSGVFAPVTLSMCSTMLFLRMGYVVGNAGVLGSVLMILISFIILVCTVLSISAIASNGAVEGGGVYFMMTRTLGKQSLRSSGILLVVCIMISRSLVKNKFH